MTLAPDKIPKKQVADLPDDIYGLFEHPHKIDEGKLVDFKEAVGEVVRSAIQEGGESRKFVLRMSAIGLPDRRLWLDYRSESYGKFSGRDYFKFLYGHVLEALILYLAKEAGHTVEDEQKEVEILGVKGHLDARIDGVLIDAKSASPFSFAKFCSGAILYDDSFGYKLQLKGYYEGTENTTSELGWLVLNKVDGSIAVILYEDFELPSATERIKHLQEILPRDEIPEKCYQEKTDEKSGNIFVPRICTYCDHMDYCWDYRAFQYKNNVAYMTKVIREPRVQEITDQIKAKNGQTKET